MSTTRPAFPAIKLKPAHFKISDTLIPLLGSNADAPLSLPSISEDTKLTSGSVIKKKNQKATTSRQKTDKEAKIYQQFISQMGTVAAEEIQPHEIKYLALSEDITCNIIRCDQTNTIIVMTNSLFDICGIECLIEIPIENIRTGTKIDDITAHDIYRSNAFKRFSQIVIRAYIGQIELANISLAFMPEQSKARPYSLAPCFVLYGFTNPRVINSFLLPDDADNLTKEIKVISIKLCDPKENYMICNDQRKYDKMRISALDYFSLLMLLNVAAIRQHYHICLSVNHSINFLTTQQQIVVDDCKSLEAMNSGILQLPTMSDSKTDTSDLSMHMQSLMRHTEEIASQKKQTSLTNIAKTIYNFLAKHDEFIKQQSTIEKLIDKIRNEIKNENERNKHLCSSSYIVSEYLGDNIHDSNSASERHREIKKMIVHKKLLNSAFQIETITQIIENYETHIRSAAQYYAEIFDCIKRMVIQQKVDQQFDPDFCYRILATNPRLINSILLAAHSYDFYFTECIMIAPRIAFDVLTEDKFLLNGLYCQPLTQLFNLTATPPAVTIAPNATLFSPIANTPCPMPPAGRPCITTIDKRVTGLPPF